jgi:predicted anti-sigma-YlaC factor YlaD
MKDPCSSISKLLEKYFDRETTGDDGILIQDHLRQCPTCQAQLKSMEELRTTLRTPVDEAVQKETFAWVWQKIEREIQTREKPSWRESIRAWFGLSFPFRRRVWIPAVAAALLIIAIVSPLLFKETPSKTELSIVEYVQSDTNNVMVFESEKENLAIIWLFEGTEGESST